MILIVGALKNHSWPSPLVIFSVLTRENNYCFSPSTALHSNTALRCIVQKVEGLYV
jgi:hypothetical protein